MKDKHEDSVLSFIKTEGYSLVLIFLTINVQKTLYFKSSGIIFSIKLFQPYPKGVGNFTLKTNCDLEITTVTVP